MTASALNSSFSTIYDDYDGNITDANISPTAGIQQSKISGLPTFPSGPIVGTTDTQILTNKTLVKPIFTGSIQVITAMGADAIDGSLGNVFTRVLGTNETFTQSNFSTGQAFVVKAQQGSGSSYTITWFAGITWITSGGTAPTQTTVSNGYTTYGFICTGTNTFDGYFVASN